MGSAEAWEKPSGSALPVIDISPFLDRAGSNTARIECATALADACQHVGFFYLVGHGIPQAGIDEILDLARQFFLETPEADKRDISRLDPGQSHGDGARGYQKVGENVTGGRRDWHEAIDLYSETRSTAAGPPYPLLRGRNLWPSHPAQLETRYHEYIGQVRQIGTAVVEAMGVALGLRDPDVFVRNTRNSFWVMRMIGYPTLPSEPASATDADADEQYSCGAHTDYGLVTLLATDRTRGALQVQAKDGQWIVADPIPDAFVVNIGDMMECWTNGLWKSTLHRVIHRGDRYRVSVPFFFEPDWDAVVQPLPECVERTGGKPTYDEVVYGEHLTKKVEGNFY